MLLSFSVSNYKSIQETQHFSMVGTALKGPHESIATSVPGVEHGVVPCAVVYGANASGKSNLIDAFMKMRSLVLRSQSKNLGDTKLGHAPFLLNQEFSEQPTTFEVSFVENQERYDYGFSFDEDGFIEEWLYSYPEGRRRKLFERKDLEIDFGATMRGPKKVLAGFVRSSTLFLSVATQNEHEVLSRVARFFVEIFGHNQITVGSSFINSNFSNEEVDPRAIQFLEAIGTGVCDYRVESSDMPEDRKKMWDDLVKLIVEHTQISEDDELELGDKNLEVLLAHRNSEKKLVYFKGNIESAGTRRLLILMNYVFRVIDRGDIAVVDEIDASLHTFAVEAIFALFTNSRINRNGAQLIATTHDTNLLNLKNLRRDEIWFAEKGPDGSSEYFSLAEIKARKGEAVERAYLQGRYGATPPSVPSELFLTFAESAE